MKAARVWQEDVRIPTYFVGQPEKNPMFIEKRVYQGSSGKVYPYPVIEKIGDTKEDKLYRVVYLENEYLRVAVLPELGGRIQRATDKTNGYDFVYYNHVIKPALVGLLGPWISGGIEFNWPQHHRPTTFMPVDYITSENADGSVSVLLHDTDRINGTKSICRISLLPGVSYIKIEGQLYNRTPLPQTFLWWANPAVPVNDHTQTVMPPDVAAVMDHGKRDVSRFPIATGVYYKHDYSEGVDISRYRNIPVPTSFMAAGSSFDFVGGYDNEREAGILHVADHHVSPGKKQWTWGCGDFGKAWDRNLTDSDGPYVELMTGVFTDNQPDFTWLKPFEEKTFTQYFMPYQKVGVIQNATKDACVNMTVGSRDVTVKVYATARFEHAVVCVKQNETVILREETALSPEHVYEGKAVFCKIPAGDADFQVAVEADGRILVSYRPAEKSIPDIPQPAEAAEDPDKIRTNEELYLTGLHLEQYRHATYRPDPYYLEGLRRDPGDARINCAYGMLLMRRGRAELAEPYFRAAIRRLTRRNPNPYDSEAYYDLGFCLFLQGKEEEAYDAFYKATWSAEQQSMAFYYLACIASRRGEYQCALEMAERSLVRNAHHIRARGLKAVLLRKLGRVAEAKDWVRDSLAIDPFDYVNGFEKVRLCSAEEAARSGEAALAASCREELARRDRQDPYNLLRTARDYTQAGFYEEALLCLAEETGAKHPLIAYYRAYYLSRTGREMEAGEAVREAEACDPSCCFPNDLEDIPVLRFAIDRGGQAAKARYYLGCLYYDRQQWELAKELWEASAEIDDTFPTVFRNLSLVYFNQCHDRERAGAALERAWALDRTDARVFYELDQLHRKTGWNFDRRIRLFEEYREVFLSRDDLCVEYATLLNCACRYQEAYDFITAHRFHPWEGGEGKITVQYETALLQLGRKALRDGHPEAAKELFLRALTSPENLGEGRLEGTKDNHLYYYLGCAEEKLGHPEAAREAFQRAAVGTDEPAGMMYYNDQPADMILYQGLAFQKLGDRRGANRRFYRLIDYGERHVRDHVRIGYFAVSLPDFLTFEDDLDVRNEAHCDFLMAMGHAGLGDRRAAAAFMREAAAKEPADFRICLTDRILREDGLIS